VVVVAVVGNRSLTGAALGLNEFKSPLPALLAVVPCDRDEFESLDEDLLSFPSFSFLCERKNLRSPGLSVALGDLTDAAGVVDEELFDDVAGYGWAEYRPPPPTTPTLVTTSMLFIFSSLSPPTPLKMLVILVLFVTASTSELSPEMYDDSENEPPLPPATGLGLASLRPRAGPTRVRGLAGACACSAGVGVVVINVDVDGDGDDDDNDGDTGGIARNGDTSVLGLACGGITGVAGGVGCGVRFGVGCVISSLGAEDDADVELPEGVPAVDVVVVVENGAPTTSSPIIAVSALSSSGVGSCLTGALLRALDLRITAPIGSSTTTRAISSPAERRLRPWFRPRIWDAVSVIPVLPPALALAWVWAWAWAPCGVGGVDASEEVLAVVVDDGEVFPLVVVVAEVDEGRE
jgi:hypothetical protein